jgi:long-chain acyl-CoA synthetase
LSNSSLDKDVLSSEAKATTRAIQKTEEGIIDCTQNHTLEPVNLEGELSIPDMFEKKCRQYATRTAFVGLGTEMTYAEMELYSRRFALYLQEVLGLKKGQKMAIMLPNILQYPVALYGALRAGLTVVNVNPLYTIRELKYQLNDSEADAVLLLENFAHVFDKLKSDTKVVHVIVTRIGDLHAHLRGFLLNFVNKTLKKNVKPYGRHFTVIPFARAMQYQSNGSVRTNEVRLDDLAFLQYTTGTSGDPKGAMLSHRNILTNYHQVSNRLSNVLDNSGQVYVCALPLYHILSMMSLCINTVSWGGKTILIANPRDTKRFIKTIKNAKFSVMLGVDALFELMLKTPGFNQVDFSHFKFCLAGGMSTRQKVAEAWQAVTGVVIHNGYGLTEASPGVTCTKPVKLTFDPSVGTPVESTLVEIRDVAGLTVENGEKGEIFVKGPQLMQGYWKRPEETAKVLSNGWLRTGDVGFFDEQGQLILVDRTKDIINVSGFNVYPGEVEKIIDAHPMVREICVLAEIDSDGNERVSAVVVANAVELTEDMIRAHCKKSLTRYKIPSIIRIVEKLPKNASGKVSKLKVRDLYLKNEL